VDGCEKLGFAARALNCFILCGLRGKKRRDEEEEEKKGKT
jgi:hypothetical protein